MPFFAFRRLPQALVGLSSIRYSSAFLSQTSLATIGQPSALFSTTNMASDTGTTPTHPLVQLLGAWNEADENRREEIADATIASESFVYSDPHAPKLYTSRDDMLGFWKVFHERVSDAELILDGPIQSHHDVAKQTFRLDRSGAPFAKGSFVAVLDEDKDRVVRLIGFLDPK